MSNPTRGLERVTDWALSASASLIPALGKRTSGVPSRPLGLLGVLLRPHSGVHNLPDMWVLLIPNR